MRPMIFTSLAQLEVIEAQEWYEAEEPGVGRRFRAELDAVLARIQTSPAQFPIVRANVRRAVLHRFPHFVLFVADPEDVITVIACLHGSRDPRRWQNRKF